MLDYLVNSYSKQNGIELLIGINISVCWSLWIWIHRFFRHFVISSMTLRRLFRVMHLDDDKIVIASGSVLYKSGMPDCEPYAIGSFFGGVLSVLLAFVVAAVVLRLLNCKVVIQKRTQWGSLRNSARRNTDNAGRTVEGGSDATVASRCGDATTTESATASSMVSSSSATATPVGIEGPTNELPTRTLNLPLGAIFEEEVTGSSIASNVQTSDRQIQEAIVARQHHPCPTCKCTVLMRRRSSFGETARRWKPSVDQGVIARRQLDCTSGGSCWTDESFQCENPNGEYAPDLSLSSNSTNNSFNTPSGEWSGVDMHRNPRSSEHSAIRIIVCKRESLMPPCGGVVSDPGRNGE